MPRGSTYITTHRGYIRYAFVHFPENSLPYHISIDNITETEPFNADIGSPYNGLRGLELGVSSFSNKYTFSISPVLAQKFREDLNIGAYSIMGYFIEDKLTAIGFIPIKEKPSEQDYDPVVMRL